MTYHLVPVAALDETRRAAVRSIYEAGFAAGLRAPFDEVVGGGHSEREAHALVEDGRPRGFAALRALGPTGWTYLRYFVVDATVRSRGVGGALWEQLTHHLTGSGFSLLVFDVEDPGDPDCASGEVLARRRRIRFYERQGAVSLPVSDYRTPHTRGSMVRWTQMLLMAARLDGDERPLPPAAPELRELVLAVYRHRWSLADGDPVVQRTLASSGLPGASPA